MITADYVREGAVVVDVGMNKATTEEEIRRIFPEDAIQKRLEDLEKRGYTLVGDVEPRTVVERASWLTPVPGGVGPLTIAMLMKNTVRAAEMRRIWGDGATEQRGRLGWGGWDIDGQANFNFLIGPVVPSPCFDGLLFSFPPSEGYAQNWTYRRNCYGQIVCP